MDAGVWTERPADEGRSVAAVVLGNDAVAAIRPCTTSQLARACVAAGFDVVIPPSWGDELVASEYLHQLADRLEYAVAPCACALVRSLLERAEGNAAVGCALAAAPPVAAARYVRAKYGESVLITFVGDCPSASDPAIDARFSPAGFLASLNRQGISVEDQPTEMIAAEADRWRRYRSMPGGIPALRYLARAPINRLLRDADAESLVSGLPESRSNLVADFSMAAGCVCADGSGDDFEPPRSQSPIVVAPNGLDLTPSPSPARVRPTLRARPEPDGAPRADASNDEPEVAFAPHNADTVPRAPVVEQPRERPAVGPIIGEVQSAARTVRPAPPARKSDGAPHEVKPPRSRLQRIAVLSLLPLGVLIVTTALGVAVYRTSDGGASAGAHTGLSGAASATALTDSIAAARMPDSSMGYVPDRASTDSARARLDSAAADSSRRRRRAGQVVPGWLPQGQRRFSPIDTGTAKPDSARRQPPDTIPPDTLRPDRISSEPNEERECQDRDSNPDGVTPTRF